jgi:hypothetical protein
MSYAALDIERIARRGEEYYERFLRAKLEPEHKGKYLVIEVETGDYELNASELAALDRAEAKHPDGVFHVIRVGFRAVGRIGGRSRRSQG